MSDTNKSLLIDLNFKTALLESLDWDENQSDSLLSYLSEVLAENTKLPGEILEFISNEYGEKAHNFIKKMFIEVYINHGLYVGNEDNYEH